MSTVNVSRQDRVAIVELNRPESMNAINVELRQALHARLSEVARDPEIGVVVLTGSGKGFCTGSDLKRAAADTDDSVRRVARTMLHDIQPTLECIARMEKPVIGAINGAAVGIGMSLAMACDFRVMSRNAYLLPSFTNIGIVPDGGLSWLLTRELGYARAMEILIEAQKLDAERCHTLGLVSRLTDAGQSLDGALAWAQSLCNRPPLAVALTKRLGRMAASQTYSDALLMEAELQTFLIRTDDAREAISAFVEKRTPTFTGR